MNRQKKRILAALIAAAMAVGMTGCGGSSKEAEPLTTEDIALLDKDGEVVLEYRMTREEAESILGIPNSETEGIIGYTLNSANYGETAIDYTDEEEYRLAPVDPVGAYKMATIAHIQTSNPEYTTARGVSVGDSADDVVSAYGTPVDFMGDPIEGDALKETINSDDEWLSYQTETEDLIISVTFYREEGKVSSIYMGALDKAQYDL